MVNLVLIASAFSTVLSVAALPNPNRRSLLPSATWYHKRDHPVHQLFERDTPLPAVGSPEWTANYLQNGALPETNIPQKWLDALHAVEAANLIPNIAPSTGQAIYPPDANVGQDPICSAYYECRHPDDIWDAPDGMIGLGVDDGPSGDPNASSRLYDFLTANNQKITHFMIGQNILYNPTVFLRAFQELDDDIAMHTWTHRYMSTLTNEQLVADFGWAMQIIHDSTGGRVPRYWRPPYGDADNRVRAIAKYVFGLTTVIWNQDSEDWTMASGGTNLDAIQQSFTNWLNGPRTPGLIVLEHEITQDDVTAFINMYPLIATAGGGAPWVVNSIAGCFDGHESGWNGKSWYLNADNDTSPVTEADILVSNTTSTSSSITGPTGTQAGAVASGSGGASATPTTTRSSAVNNSISKATVGALTLLVAGLSFAL